MIIEKYVNVEKLSLYPIVYLQGFSTFKVYLRCKKVQSTINGDKIGFDGSMKTAWNTAMFLLKREMN